MTSHAEEVHGAEWIETKHFPFRALKATLFVHLATSLRDAPTYKSIALPLIGSTWPLKVAGEAAGHTLDEAQLICKDRDGFLTEADIASMLDRLRQGGPIRVTGFPERLPQVPVNDQGALWPVAPVALHVTEAARRHEYLNPK